MKKYYKNQLFSLLLSFSPRFLNYIKTNVYRFIANVNHGLHANFLKVSNLNKSTELLHNNTYDNNTYDENMDTKQNVIKLKNLNNLKMDLKINMLDFMHTDLEKNNNLENNNIVIINLSHPDIIYDTPSQNKLTADSIDRELNNLLIPFPSSTRIH